MVQFLEILALFFLCVPAVGFQLGQCCCVDCVTTGCTNGGLLFSPVQYQITLSGFTDDKCSGCGNLNGTYSVEFTDCEPACASIGATLDTWANTTPCSFGPHCNTSPSPWESIGVSVCLLPTESLLTGHVTHSTRTPGGGFTADGHSNTYYYQAAAPVNCGVSGSFSLDFVDSDWGTVEFCGGFGSPPSSASGSGASCSPGTFDVSVV